MKNQNKKGFTLVELVIVIAVIAILAGVLIGTFATVISRANQSKAVQEWKATVDAAYLDYVAENHKAPTFVKIDKTAKTVKFGDDFFDTATYELTTTVYTQTGSGTTEDPYKYTLNQKYSSYFILDETNKVYLVWNEAGEASTYSVVASEVSLVDETTLFTNKYVKTGTDTYGLASGYRKLVYSSSDTYYGK